MDGGGSGEKRSDHDSNNALPTKENHSSNEIEAHISIDIFPPKSHEDIESAKSTSLEDTGPTVNAYIAQDNSGTFINKVSFAEERNLVRVFSDQEKGLGKTEKSLSSKPSRSETSTCVRYSYRWERKSSQSSMPEVHGKACKSTCDFDMGELLQSTLANYLWTYPRVEQRITAYPMAMTGAARHNALAAARKKSEHIKHELEKEPTKHRLSAEDPKIAKLGLGTKPVPKQSQQQQQQHHNKPMIINTNMSMAAATVTRQNSGHEKLENKPTRKKRSYSSGSHMSPYKGGTGRRASQGTYVGSQISIRSNPEQTQSILHNIREQNNKAPNRVRAKFSKCKEKCCGPCLRCCASRKCTYVTFFTVIAIVTIGCVCAIVFPIVRMYI